MNTIHPSRSQSNIVLSIIIPYYNSFMTLPKLLSSIQDQKGLNLEVVVVDDCSDVSPRSIVDEFIAQGLTIRLLELHSRQFTKEARLAGFEASSGEVVAFADADDWFHGDQALSELVSRMQKEDADILHFAVYDYCPALSRYTPKESEAPYAEKLCGSAGFAFYIQNGLRGHCLWGKLYLRSLLLRCFSIAKSIKTHRYCEDYFLYTIFAFHCRHYIGIKIYAYVYNQHYDEEMRIREKRLGRLFTMDSMETFLVPYFQEQGLSSHITNIMMKKLISRQKYHAVEFLTSMRHEYGREFSPLAVKNILGTVSAEDAFRLLLKNAPARANAGKDERARGFVRRSLHAIKQNVKRYLLRIR